MTGKHLQLAIDEAYQELRSIEVRKAQLEAFIANAAPLLSKSSDTPRPSIPAAKSPRKPSNRLPARDRHAPGGGDPLWKSILLSINGKHAEFSIREALQALDRMGRGIDSKSADQIVRSTLKRKTEYFEKIGTGRFRVKPGVMPGTTPGVGLFSTVPVQEEAQ